MAAGPPPIPPAEPASLFRPEALRRQQEAEDGRGLLQVGPPWTWILLLLLISGLAGALAAAVFGRVEVNGLALAAGDGAALAGETTVAVKALEQAEFMIFDLD